MQQLLWKMYRNFFVFILTAVCCGFLIACGDSENGAEESSYLIYYLDADQTGFEAEEVKIRNNSDDIVETLTELFKKLQSEDTDGKHNPPISKELEVSDFQIKENQLTVYFTASYNNESGLDEVLTRAAIVKTLCQVPGVEYVEFYVEDQPLMINGSAVGLMTEDNFILDIDDGKTEQRKNVTLYFPTESGNSLCTVRTEITYNAAQPLAQMIVQKLIDGPDSVEEAASLKVTNAVPANTVLNSTTIRDNICYVDLSKEFTEMVSGVSSDVAIYSIVDTLCELSNVNKVQFLIDGELQEKYGETLDFYLPFERNLDFVTGGIE
jgi:germination protein M